MSISITKEKVLIRHPDDEDAAAIWRLVKDSSILWRIFFVQGSCEFESHIE